MPTEELGQGAVDLVLAHTVFNCQTAVIGATDEVRSTLDSAENLVVDINQAPDEHHIGIQPRALVCFRRSLLLFPVCSGKNSNQLE